MKPAAVVLVLSLGIFSGGAPARAEGPWQFAEPLPLASPFAGSDEYGSWPSPWPQRPPLVPDGADLWSDYRGACIEHDLYRPRFLASSSGEHQRPLLSAVGNWLDGLFAWMPLHRREDCLDCDASATAEGNASRMPTPAPPADSLAPRAIPHLTPVPLPESDPPPRVQSVLPAPLPPTPVQVVPVEPGPLPRTPDIQPPANEIPKQIPPRGPIVELAPEPAIPAEVSPPATTVPRNRVPRPGQQLPRNAIPR